MLKILISIVRNLDARATSCPEFWHFCCKY